MALKISSAPSVEPVSSAEARAHLRVDTSDDDTLIGNLIKAAREYAEQVTRRALVTQTWELTLDEFPGEDEIEIPLPPLQSVTNVKYYDEDGVTVTTMSSADYVVDTYNEPGKIVLTSGSTWPSDTLREANGVIIKFVAGYGDAGANVPQAIRQAILLIVGHLYENRENEAVMQGTLQNVSMGAIALLWPYRVLKLQ